MDTIIDLFSGMECGEFLIEGAGQQGSFRKEMWQNVGDKGVDSPAWAPSIVIATSQTGSSTAPITFHSTRPQL